jgi:hypothetical protein
MLSCKTEGERFTMFVTLSNCRMKRVSEFCRTSSACDTLQPNVSRLLGNDQKEYRVGICSELTEQTENGLIIFAIITGDESWVYGYQPGTKQHSSQCVPRECKFETMSNQYWFVRFEVFTAMITNNAVFWDIKTQFVPHRKHITSPLKSPVG